MTRSPSPSRRTDRRTFPESHAMSTVTALPTDPVLPLRQALERMRSAFRTDMAPSLATRRDRLSRLARMTKRHATDIMDTISADFGHRSPHETLIADLLAVDEAIKHAQRHLARLDAPAADRDAKSSTGPATTDCSRSRWASSAWWRRGTIRTSCRCCPALAALAAGNRVMIKPSELTPRTAELMARIVRESFADDELAVFPGDAAIGKAFVELPFDHLFFTGSTAVGRLVAQAAAKNLTPVTLELGGKSPVIVDADGSFESIAPKIAIGKLFNAGQTCIAPDYALVPRARDRRIRDGDDGTRWAELYPTLAGNADYTSIVSERHYARLAGLIADAKSRGARLDRGEPGRGERSIPLTRKLAPALVLDVDADMADHARGDLRTAASGGSVRHARRRPRLCQRARSAAGALLVRRRRAPPRSRAAPHDRGRRHRQRLPHALRPGGAAVRRRRRERNRVVSRRLRLSHLQQGKGRVLPAPPRHRAAVACRPMASCSTACWRGSQQDLDFGSDR